MACLSVVMADSTGQRIALACPYQILCMPSHSIALGKNSMSPLRKASLSVLTQHNTGQPLALLEPLQVACQPIALLPWLLTPQHHRAFTPEPPIKGCSPVPMLALPGPQS